MKTDFFRGQRLYGFLGAIAVTLGALAAIAGSPVGAANARIDVASLANTVEHEDDHVTAVELARWIKDRRQNLRIVDIRDSVEFAEYHIPGAERIDLAGLIKTPFRKNETIVLYSGGGAHAAQGWVFLRALGYTQVFFLRGGLAEWLDDVMSPAISATASDSVRAEFRKVSEISRYFGGVPRVGETTPPRYEGRHATSVTPASTVARVRGRGC